MEITFILFNVIIFKVFIINFNFIFKNNTTKKTKISEGNLVRENVKSLSNSVTKFCDQEICEEFQFFRH